MDLLQVNYIIFLALSAFLNKQDCSHSRGLRGADPGFLERGFICIKRWGVRFADFTSFFLNIP